MLPRQVGAGPDRRRRIVRVPRPQARAAALLTTLVIGGLAAAAAPTVLGDGPTPVSAAYALGLNDGATDPGTTGKAAISAAVARVRLDQLAASRATREPRTVLPAPGRLSTCFCMRWGVMHWGIDLAAPRGTPILAATDGVVLRAGPATGYGNAIWIQDEDGDVQVYGHMRYYFVHAGQIVHAGDLIAKVGSEGQSTGPHLHFQLDRGTMFGPPFDPLGWFHARGVTVPGA